MIEKDKSIGEIIRRIRKEKSLSMKQLGSMIGVSEQAVSQYELGKRKLTIDQINKLALALGVSAEILIAPELTIIDANGVNVDDKYSFDKDINDGAFDYHVNNNNPGNPLYAAYFFGVEIGRKMASGEITKDDVEVQYGKHFAKSEDKSLFEFLQKYLQLDEEGKRYVVKSLELSLGMTDGETK